MHQKIKLDPGNSVDIELPNGKTLNVEATAVWEDGEELYRDEAPNPGSVRAERMWS